MDCRGFSISVCWFTQGQPTTRESWNNRNADPSKTNNEVLCRNAPSKWNQWISNMINTSKYYSIMFKKHSNKPIEVDITIAGFLVRIPDVYVLYVSQYMYIPETSKGWQIGAQSEDRVSTATIKSRASLDHSCLHLCHKFDRFVCFFCVCGTI